MIFGKSVFQSVVDRLQDERDLQEDDHGENPTMPNRPYIKTDFLAAQSMVTPSVEEHIAVDHASAYRTYDLPQEDLVLPSGDKPEDVCANAPPLQIEEKSSEPSKDFSYLQRTSKQDLESELKLRSIKSLASLQELRRKFARENHPDTVPEEYRDLATMRMTQANQLIDDEIKQRRLMSRLGI